MTESAAKPLWWCVVLLVPLYMVGIPGRLICQNPSSLNHFANDRDCQIVWDLLQWTKPGSRCYHAVAVSLYKSCMWWCWKYRLVADAAIRQPLHSLSLTETGIAKVLLTWYNVISAHSRKNWWIDALLKTGFQIFWNPSLLGGAMVWISDEPLSLLCSTCTVHTLKFILKNSVPFCWP